MQLPAAPGEEIAAGKGQSSAAASLCGRRKTQAGSSTRFNITKIQWAPFHSFSGVTVSFRNIILEMNPDRHLPFSLHETPLPLPWIKQHGRSPGCIPLTGARRAPDSARRDPRGLSPVEPGDAPGTRTCAWRQRGRRCRAPLGFWPSESPESVSQSRERVRGEKGNTLCSQIGDLAQAARGAWCWTGSAPLPKGSQAGMCLMSEPFPSKFLIQRKGNFTSDKELTRNSERSTRQTFPMKNFLPVQPGALSPPRWSREAFAGQCSLKKQMGPSALVTGREIKSSPAGSSSRSAPTEGWEGVHAREFIPGVPC